MFPWDRLACTNALNQRGQRSRAGYAPVSCSRTLEHNDKDTKGRVDRQTLRPPSYWDSPPNNLPALNKHPVTHLTRPVTLKVRNQAMPKQQMTDFMCLKDVVNCRWSTESVHGAWKKALDVLSTSGVGKHKKESACITVNVKAKHGKINPSNTSFNLQRNAPSQCFCYLVGCYTHIHKTSASLKTI